MKNSYVIIVSAIFQKFLPLTSKMFKFKLQSAAMTATALVLFTQLFPILASTAQAAPHPTTGFSAINQLQNSIVFSQLGFSLKNIPSAWNLQSIEQNNDIKKATLKNQTALLQLAVESVPRNTDLEKYVRRYLKDYHQFGFDLTKTKAFKDSKNSRTHKILLELKQKKNRASSFQIFTIHKTNVLSATCVDQTEHFSKTQEECQQILNTLNWTH